MKSTSIYEVLRSVNYNVRRMQPCMCTIAINSSSSMLHKCEKIGSQFVGLTRAENSFDDAISEGFESLQNRVMRHSSCFYKGLTKFSQRNCGSCSGGTCSARGGSSCDSCSLHIL